MRRQAIDVRPGTEARKDSGGTRSSGVSVRSRRVSLRRPAASIGVAAPTGATLSLSTVRSDASSTVKRYPASTMLSPFAGMRRSRFMTSPPMVCASFSGRSISRASLTSETGRRESMR